MHSFYKYNPILQTHKVRINNKNAIMQLHLQIKRYV